MQSSFCQCCVASNRLSTCRQPGVLAMGFVDGIKITQDSKGADKSWGRRLKRWFSFGVFEWGGFFLLFFLFSMTSECRVYLVSTRWAQGLGESSVGRQTCYPPADDGGPSGRSDLGPKDPATQTAAPRFPPKPRATTYLTSRST